MNRTGRYLWLLGLATLFTFLLSGCSSLSTLYAYNGYGKPIKLIVDFQEGYRDSKPEVFEVAFDPRERKEVTKWFSAPPAKLKVRVYDGDKLLQVVDFRNADYPPKMRKGSSMGSEFDLQVTPAGMTLHDPSAWDYFKQSGTALTIGFFGLNVLLVIWLLLKANQSRQEKLLKPYKPD